MIEALARPQKFTQRGAGVRRAHERRSDEEAVGAGRTDCEEIRRAVQAGARMIGVNCRDLRTFRTDPALTAELVAQIPAGITRIGESGIKTHDDLLRIRSAGADGFLVGTALMRAPDPGAALRELLNQPQSSELTLSL